MDLMQTPTGTVMPGDYLEAERASRSTTRPRNGWSTGPVGPIEGAEESSQPAEKSVFYDFEEREGWTCPLLQER